MMEVVDNDFLVTYLDTIDERLLEYLDDEENLSVDTVKRLQRYALALFDDSISPAQLMEDWPDWYSLAPAFVAAYCPGELEALKHNADFLFLAEEGEDVALTGADRAYLEALGLQLDMYPEMRSTTEE
ncbi:MAG: hypothetical protein ABSB99_06570 [Acidimicrobiales bacterium]|jgi:hypothetical protein